MGSTYRVNSRCQRRILNHSQGLLTWSTPGVNSRGQLMGSIYGSTDEVNSRGQLTGSTQGDQFTRSTYVVNLRTMEGEVKLLQPCYTIGNRFTYVIYMKLGDPERCTMVGTSLILFFSPSIRTLFLIFTGKYSMASRP